MTQEINNPPDRKESSCTATLVWQMALGKFAARWRYDYHGKLRDCEQSRLFKI